MYNKLTQMTPQVSDCRLSCLYFFRELKRYLNYVFWVLRTLILNCENLSTSLLNLNSRKPLWLLPAHKSCILWNCSALRHLVYSIFLSTMVDIYGFFWMLKLFPIRADSALPKETLHLSEIEIVLFIFTVSFCYYTSYLKQ